MPEEYLGNEVEDTVTHAKGVCIGFLHQLDEEALLNVQTPDGRTFWMPQPRARVLVGED